MWVGVLLSWLDSPPAQNLFQDFKVGLNVELWNLFFLLYLAQAFIDDYAYPTKA